MQKGVRVLFYLDDLIVMAYSREVIYGQAGSTVHSSVVHCATQSGLSSLCAY